ncbi:MAG: glutamate-1-semialdehyde 2,1-aminomutase [Elusimicrobia bacterium GWA2_61_42]|nr:MAG: glutamate-1-semialdehyde 2,1-aminomutase [Elusimicrobia bacterium GWA2_61_42]OGR77895.1 MAG: glutamate-1-semialdehyde 2,1-aminomutase [Elusimicrobia bacterium GWC2_61_25]
MAEHLKLDNSERLYKEAQELIPGGMMGIRRPYNFVPGEYPIFFDSAKGGKVTDADGNEYLDMLCAYGPIIIGHREREIDAAVIKQIKEKGFCMSIVQEVQNTLAKKVISLVPSAEKVVFTKTGSDSTTLATRIARAFTNKPKIIRCGYHGWADWCVEGKGGVLPKTYEDTLEFEYNDLQQLEDLLKANPGQVAGIIVTPIGHPNAHEVQMPKPGFLEGAKKLAEAHGTVLIFDEIRTGFRVSMGGAQKLFGVTPHMSVFGKAMANGYEISMVAGRKDIMDVLISKAFVSSTYFNNTLPMVAALKTMEILERDNMLDVIAKRGHAFCKKVRKHVKASGLAVQFTGEPWMPYITFDKDETGAYKKTRVNFYTQLIRRKVFLQPYHHGYVAYRHSVKDLNYAADMIAESLEEAKKAA